MKTNMRRKGYQRDLYRGSLVNSYPAGENKSLEQCITEVDKRFDDLIRETEIEYDHAFKMIQDGLSGEELFDECRAYLMWNVKFDDEHHLIPLDRVLRLLNEARRKVIDQTKYSKWGGYQKRIINKDNSKFCYNGSNSDCEWHHKVRVPSLKRSDATWRRFYELFPGYEEMSHDAEMRRKYNLKKL